MAEVLVALFLMALGSIAILTMFPLGMYHMGQALKDDRTAQCASQADSYMRNYWRRFIVQSEGGPQGSGPQGAFEPFVQAFTDPNATNPAPVLARPTAPVFSGPSYPVFVDPIGFVCPWGSQNNPFQRDWVAIPPNSSNPPFIPRRSLNVFTAGLQNPQRGCSMMDGYGFAENGTANNLGGTTIERELRYNWLWVLQRPDNAVWNTASMTIVVFDRRAYQYAPPAAETSYTWDGTNPPTQANVVVFNPLTTTIQIPKTIGVPPVQKGGWIMDGTASLRHAIFYRVVSVTDNPNNVMIINSTPTVVPTTDLEVQSPIRRLDGGTGSYTGTVVYLAGVSEVFERANLGPNY